MADYGVTELKSELLEIIQAVPNVGFFAVAGKGELAPLTLTYILVKGVAKPIILPIGISQEDAQLLVAVGQQAPYGRGMDTVVDTTVRLAWQYDPSIVTITSVPAGAQGFNHTLRNITAEACAALGINVKKHPVQAK